MPTLVVDIGMKPRQLGLNKVDVLCRLEDEFRFSSWIGRDVLLAGRTGEDAPHTAFARATLARFASGTQGHRAEFTAVELLASEQQVPHFPDDQIFALLPDDPSFTQFEQDAFFPGVSEASSFFYPLDIYGQIAQQVRAQAGGLCAFSGRRAALGKASATPIQPTSWGGEVHVRNFIYLEDEAAEMFNRFAWTVGPDLEIIVDAYAMTARMLSSVNPTGKLLVSDDPSERPDERALAWHRDQFLQRLR